MGGQTDIYILQRDPRLPDHRVFGAEGGGGGADKQRLRDGKVWVCVGVCVGGGGGRQAERSVQKLETYALIMTCHFMIWPALDV